MDERAQLTLGLPTGFGIEQDLELDLDGARPLSCVPTLLGKLLNTLANDRNVKSVALSPPRVSRVGALTVVLPSLPLHSPPDSATNWQTALRRQYNRRQRDHNPFVRWVRLGKPGDVTSASIPVPAEPVASTSAAPAPAPAPVEGEGEDGQLTLADEYDDDKTYWDTVDVDWLDVDLETKVSARGLPCAGLRESGPREPLRMATVF